MIIPAKLVSTWRIFRRPSSIAALAFALLLSLSASPAGLAQSTPPLNLTNNYFVTGDYVVGGVGLRGLGDASGYATGQITIPDKNPGIQGATSVPSGADVVAAYLVWETVEKSQSLYAGQSGFFGYDYKTPNNATVSNIYPITGRILGSNNSPPSWSSGGCTGSSNGSTTLRVYMADVRPYLPLDSNGRIHAGKDGDTQTYQVRLADSGSNGSGAPLTLGATLIIIFRVANADPALFPLKSILLYTGAYAPGTQNNPELLQQLQGFYQASLHSPIQAKITHIVGDGQPNKWEYVNYVNQAGATTNLNSLYTGYPAFPGYYNQNSTSLTGGGSWDNPTWLLNGSVGSGDASGTTTVYPGSTNSGCVDWGAIVMSTTVQSSDGDGLLDVWKADKVYKGYVDAITNTWVALPGATQGEKDLFVEIDWASNLDLLAGAQAHSHLPTQAALDQVGRAFANGGVHVHFDLGPNSSGSAGLYNNDPYVIQYPISYPPGVNPPPAGTGGNAISESLLVCNDNTSVTPAIYCPFPGAAVTTWKGGFELVRDLQSGTLPNGSSSPLGFFQTGRLSSYHYVLFGHAMGMPRTVWATMGAAPGLTNAASQIATLQSIVVNNNVGTVTLFTPNPPEYQYVPLLMKPGDQCNMIANDNCDRVTIAGVLSPLNLSLNGVYKLRSTTAGNFMTLSNISTSGTPGGFITTFSITTSGVPNGTYNYANEPQLVLAYGGPDSTSGHSDGGGGDSLVTFGLWPADNVPNCQSDPSQLKQGQTPCVDKVGTLKAQAGTLMHELGHTFTLMHGGLYYPGSASNPNPATGKQVNDGNTIPYYDWNCKPNHLSVMSYSFQIHGFPDALTNPSNLLFDYSGQTLPNLDEGLLNESNGIGSDHYPPAGQSALAAHYTRWWAPLSSLDTTLQSSTGAPRYSLAFCDGTPIPVQSDGVTPLTQYQMVRVDGTTYSFPIDWDNDYDDGAGEANLVQNINLNPFIDTTGPMTTFPVYSNQLLGFNDWLNADWLQLGARSSVGAFSGGALTSLGGGALTSLGGGSLTSLGGGALTSLGGGSLTSLGGGSLTSLGGGALTSLGGGALTSLGGSEQNSETANATSDPPSQLQCVNNPPAKSTCTIVTVNASSTSYTPYAEAGKSVTLSWTPPDFGQVRSYYIWRATGVQTLQNPSAFSLIKKLTGTPPSTFWTDTNIKNNTTYTYFVTDSNIKNAQSSPSNLITVSISF